MIIKLGFQVDNINFDFADQIIDHLEETLKDWCVIENNRVCRKGSNTVAAYLFEKTVRNEKILEAGLL